jgi:hypothetical protein
MTICFLILLIIDLQNKLLFHHLVLKGHGFSRAATRQVKWRVLTPEGTTDIAPIRL